MQTELISKITSEKKDQALEIYSFTTNGQFHSDLFQFPLHSASMLSFASTNAQRCNVLHYDDKTIYVYLQKCLFHFVIFPLRYYIYYHLCTTYYIPFGHENRVHIPTYITFPQYIVCKQEISMYFVGFQSQLYIQLVYRPHFGT